MNVFHNIFNPKPKKKLVEDFSFIKTDIHSHLIPNIDDGSDSYDSSVAMARRLKDMGYKKIITTPHFNHDLFDVSTENVTEGIYKLKQVLAQNHVDIEIEAAAEYFVDFEFLNLINSTPPFTFGGNYILIEFSFYTEPQNIIEIIFELQVKKLRIVLAHAERYFYWHNNMQKLKELKDKDVYFQLNINSLLDQYGPNVRKQAQKMIENNLFEFVGSDAHSIDHLITMKKALHNKYFQHLIHSGKLLNHSL